MKKSKGRLWRKNMQLTRQSMTLEEIDALDNLSQEVMLKKTHEKSFGVIRYDVSSDSFIFQTRTPSINQFLGSVNGISMSERLDMSYSLVHAPENMILVSDLFK